MSTYDYGWEKLHLAVHSLAGASTQKERLVNAVAYNLIHIIPENNLPPELRDEFKQFMEEITSVEAKGNEGRVRATVDSLDEIGTSRAIEKIISLYDTVCRHMLPIEI
ncbi:MAG: hypothetical protein OEV64_09670 [Desulfobulbaceae bacterium]|nr:hypothetical protein [Desulfobulbaceae bacterium]